MASTVGVKPTQVAMRLNVQRKVGTITSHPNITAVCASTKASSAIVSATVAKSSAIANSGHKFSIDFTSKQYAFITDIVQSMHTSLPTQSTDTVSRTQTPQPINITGTQLVKIIRQLKKHKESTEKKAKSTETKLQQFDDTRDHYKINHWKTYKSQINDIIDRCIYVYEHFVFGGKEAHYQSALEMELRSPEYFVQSEVARIWHYKTSSDEEFPLAHDVRGREDLVLPRQKLILELKQIKQLTDKEFNQIYRYMNERSTTSVWGKDTRAMLINFGDNDLEIWYMFYDKTTNRIVRLLVHQSLKPEGHPLVETFSCI